jgi:hypothetical protein
MPKSTAQIACGFMASPYYLTGQLFDRADSLPAAFGAAQGKIRPEGGQR